MNELFDTDEQQQKVGEIECLGLTFESEDDRRAYFTEKLREKLKDPEFRKIDGFPLGEDEDILALSDPPYYTACPNPFLEDFVEQEGKPYNPEEPYHREPFAADVSEGKNDPIYNAHSYHTKVPHKAIMRYILHYTEPILEQNFLMYDGNGPVPNQIHSYLSSNFKDLRGLQKDDPKLKEKAKGRWYVPDPSKAADPEKMREKALLREFQNYIDTSKKKLRQVRLEAVRAGFKKAWQERDYRIIIAIAEKIDDKILQEDEKILMWYDQALTRVRNEDVW